MSHCDRERHVEKELCDCEYCKELVMDLHPDQNTKTNSNNYFHQDAGVYHKNKNWEDSMDFDRCRKNNAEFEEK